MILKIEKDFLRAEEKNELYKAGYRYIVEGDYKVLDSIDPWSGMPNTTNNIYAFTDKAEAEAYAVTQIRVFYRDGHAYVEELPEHTQTWDEYREEEARKKAEQKAKKEANEARKAAEAGMTVEEYKAERKRIALVKKVTKEIAELEAELTRKKAFLEELEG